MKTVLIANCYTLSIKRSPILHNKTKATPKWLSLSLIALAFILYTPDSYSQIIQDVGGVSFTVHAKATFKDMPSESDNSDTKFRLSTYDAWLPLPPVTLGKTTIFSNLNYRLMDFKYDDNKIDNPNHLQKIQEMKSVIIIRRPISTRWSILGILMPTLASDTKTKISFDALYMDGILGVSRRFGSHSNVEIGLGVHVMYSYGETIITPGISIDYRSTDDKWLAQFYWPRLNVLYRVTPITQLGFAGSIDWTRMNLTNYIHKQENKEVDYAQFSTVHFGLQVHQKITKGITLQLQGGMGLINSYELYDSNQKSIKKYAVSNLPYAKITLSYRINNQPNRAKRR